MSDIIKTSFTEIIPNIELIGDHVDLMNLRAEFREIQFAAQELATYCEARQCAVLFRKQGEFQSAQVYELAAKAVLARFPEIAKWTRK
jgi:hypothetical protein